MASKFPFIYMTLALATLSAFQLEASGAAPVIHVINAEADNNSPPINFNVKAGGSLKGSAQLRPKQNYEISVQLVNEVYYATAIFGLRFTAFHAYEPSRDAGQAAVYWKADEVGFSLSYDGVNWKEVAPWESE